MLEAVCSSALGSIAVHSSVALGNYCKARRIIQISPEKTCRKVWWSPLQCLELFCRCDANQNNLISHLDSWRMLTWPHGAQSKGRRVTGARLLSHAGLQALWQFSTVFLWPLLPPLVSTTALRAPFWHSLPFVLYFLSCTADFSHYRLLLPISQLQSSLDQTQSYHF